MKILLGEEETRAKHWMNEAALVAMDSRCLKAKGGCVIVGNNEVIGRGYIAPPQDLEEGRMCGKTELTGKPGYDRTCCVHAEWRALMDALRRHPERVSGAVLYFTRADDRGDIIFSGEPLCTVCSRLAWDVGIKEFVLWHERGLVTYPINEYNRFSYAYTH